MSLLTTLNNSLYLPTDINKIIVGMIHDHEFVIDRIYYELVFTGVIVKGCKVYEENCPLFKIYDIEGDTILIRQYDKDGYGFISKRKIIQKNGLQAVRLNYNFVYSNNKPECNNYVVIHKLI